jgi:hypothetical protein
MRLTPEREAEIRELATLNQSVMTLDLLDEIDALREEHAIWEKHGLCQIVKERDTLKAALEVALEVARTHLKQMRGFYPEGENYTATQVKAQEALDAIYASHGAEGKE